MSKSNCSCDLQRYFMNLFSHYSLVERVKGYEDAFGNLTDKVQKLCVWSYFFKPRPFSPVVQHCRPFVISLWTHGIEQRV